MKFTVQYTRYFEEFGCTDLDQKEFDNLECAYDFYFYQKSHDKNVKLYAGKDRIA